MSRRPSLRFATILGIAGLSLVLLIAAPSPAQKAGPGSPGPSIRSGSRTRTR